jgi:hypothetical protein
VQLTEGRGRKPAFQYIGPPVEDLEITEEQKQEMPAIRYRTYPVNILLMPYGLFYIYVRKYALPNIPYP